MSSSEGKKELSGIARSVDALFETDPAADDPAADLQVPPLPDAKGEPLTGAPIRSDGAPRPSPDRVKQREEPESTSTEGEGADPPTSSEPDAPPVPPAYSEASEVAEPAQPPPLPEPHEAAEPSELPQPVDPPPLPETREWAPVREVGTSVGGHEVASPADLEPSGEVDDDAPAPTPLDLAVDAYLAGDTDEAAEIESLASEMMEARRLDPVARALGRLAIAAGEPPDESILQLAHSIGTPVVYGRLAGQIGTEHEEPSLEEYFLACRTLGAPMAAAIRDHLAESTDRHARRIHCQALAEMGDEGRRMIEEMVEDENRFLVRNAVAILGDTGGDRAVELVTTALANPDARVRREALRSLAKLGDESSGELVLGLLEDSDQEVRIQAAVTAGELHVERALRSIIKLLDDASDPDEVAPLIRALGHLGDPGAVPSIEKHVVPRLFSKPPTSIRIVGYRALHQIGTPHARRLLNQALNDKDPEIRTAVKQILGLR